MAAQRVVEGIGEEFTDVQKAIECFLPALCSGTWMRREDVRLRSESPQNMQAGTQIPLNQRQSRAQPAFCQSSSFGRSSNNFWSTEGCHQGLRDSSSQVVGRLTTGFAHRYSKLPRFFAGYRAFSDINAASLSPSTVKWNVETLGLISTFVSCATADVQETSHYFVMAVARSQHRTSLHCMKGNVI
jgi:hypothetical protein